MTSTPNPDMVKRLIGMLDTATDDEWTHGTYWYATAHNAAAQMAVKYGVPVRHCVGVIAALSPRLPWARNVMYADRVFATGYAPVLKSNLAKAQRIASGEEPLSVLGGSKVRAFYANLLAPGMGDDVCVDRHAVDAALGQVGTDASRKRILESKRGYEHIAAASRVAAAARGISPAQCQAIIWLAWRNAKGLAA